MESLKINMQSLTPDTCKDINVKNSISITMSTSIQPSVSRNAIDIVSQEMEEVQRRKNISLETNAPNSKIKYVKSPSHGSHEQIDFVMHKVLNVDAGTSPTGTKHDQMDVKNKDAKSIKKNENHIETLQKLHEIKEPDSMLRMLISKCKNILETCLISLSERTLESYRTQEHLIHGTGSWFGIQANAFKSHLSHYESSDGPEFEQLNKELDNGVVDASDLLKRKFIPGGEKRWADKVKGKIENLQLHESLLIDAGSMKATHSMMMRITKKENGKFDLQFANSGAGLEDNQDFHPKEESKTSGVQRRQLVGVIKDIDKSLLEGDFFYDFARISEGKEPLSILIVEKPSVNTSEQTDTNIPEDIDVINKMYGALRGLGTPQTMIEKQYYSRAQITNSCAAGCMWAMTKVILNEKQFHQIEIDMKVKAITHHYKQIKSGYDTSSTRKIMVLDLIQSLKKECSEIENASIILSIEKEIKEKLYIDEKHDVEVKISNSSKVKIDNFLLKDEKNEGKFKLPSFKMKISPNLQSISGMNVGSSLVAHLSIQKEPDGEVYDIKKDGDALKGEKCADTAALLCFNVANADYNAYTQNMNSLINDFEGIKSVSLSEAKRNIKSCYLLSSLASEFNFDYTRSGIAKRKCLSLLSIHLFCGSCGIDLKNFDKGAAFTPDNPDHINKLVALTQKKIGRLELDSKDIESFNIAIACLANSSVLYRNLEVVNHLSKDNLWINALNELGKNKIVPEIVVAKGHVTNTATVSAWVEAPTIPEAAVNFVAQNKMMSSLKP